MGQTRRTIASRTSLSDGAYERALSSLSRDLATGDLLELRAIERDACDAETLGDVEDEAMRTGKTRLSGAVVIAPVVFEDRVLGALSARFASEHAAARCRAHIETGAERLGPLLEVARLARQNAKTIRDWETVVHALQSIAGGSDLHAICDDVRRHLTDAIEFDCLTVARTPGESDELEVLYRFEPGATRIATQAPDASEEAFPSVIVVPLKSGAATLGLLSLQAGHPGAFGDRERALLEPIAEGLALAIARSRLEIATEEARIERGVIVEVARALARDRHLSGVFGEICRQTQRLVDSVDFYVALASRDGTALELTYHMVGDRRVPLTKRDVVSPRMDYVFRTGRPIICNDRAEMAAHGMGPEVRPDLQSVAIVPLRVGSTVVGVMNCGSPHERAYGASRADLLVAIGEQAGIAVNNARMYEDAADRSNRDPLTNLLNHRAVMHMLQCVLAERAENIAVVLLDVEAFRMFNSTFGHHVGDEVLRLVADCVGRAIRASDFAARYGDDEFLVVLMDGEHAAAQAFLERFRVELSTRPLHPPSGAPIPVAFCAGVAVAPADGTTRERLVAAADERLQAERAGRSSRVSPDTSRAFPALTEVQQGLLVAIQRKDLYTRAHINFVGEMALDFAQALGLDAEMRRALFLGSLLHDIGKICIPDSIISKPSSLTPPEREIMQRHTMLGYELVRGVEGMELASLAVLHHHERMDGHGYPYGLAGTSIPAIARMVTVVDAFSAMVLDRPYHKAMPNDEAKAELLRCAGAQFDADYVSVFCSLL